VAVVLIISFLIVRPFLVAVLSAAALAFLFYPFCRRLQARLPGQLWPETLSALLTTLLVIIIVMIPVVFVAVIIAREARDGYVFLQAFVASSQWPPAGLPAFLAERLKDFSSYRDVVIDVAGQLIRWLQGVLLKGVPSAALNIFITIFSLYYFLKNGGALYQFFQDFLPLPAGKYQKIINRFDDLTRGMILGQIVVGAVQGILAWVGFIVLAVPNPFLWGFATALISIIPLLGAVMVWLPIAVFLLISGHMTGVYWKGLVLLAYGALVISTIDNILKPKIVGDHAKIHPLVILFGILGGIQLFGIAGILIGPMILTLFDVMIEIYREVI
jgi:predicted PurR-regulated permease PerM